jgi:hypothetical protein
MKTFDRPFCEALLSRLESLPEDVKPQWGTLNRGQLIAHFAHTLRYTLGEGPELPFRGNFMSKTVIKFLILNGFKEIPQNIRLPRPKEVPKDQWFQEGPMETLREAIDAYFAAEGAGKLVTRIHPFFGPLRPEEWRKLHYRHFRHHLKQFGIDGGM